MSHYIINSNTTVSSPDINPSQTNNYRGGGRFLEHPTGDLDLARARCISNIVIGSIIVIPAVGISTLAYTFGTATVLKGYAAILTFISLTYGVNEFAKLGVNHVDN